jgi:hypothetical protein
MMRLNRGLAAAMVAVLGLASPALAANPVTLHF